jgi:integral membrane sensor domain MASE1
LIYCYYHFIIIIFIISDQFEYRTHEQNLAEAQAAAHAVMAGQRTRALIASSKQSNKDSQVLTSDSHLLVPDNRHC